MLMFCPSLAWKQMSGISAFPTGVGRLGPGCPPTQWVGLPSCLSSDPNSPSHLPHGAPLLLGMTMMCKAIKVALYSKKAAGPQRVGSEGARGRAASPHPFLQPVQEPQSKERLKWSPRWKDRVAAWILKVTSCWICWILHIHPWLQPALAGCEVLVTINCFRLALGTCIPGPHHY